VMPSKRPIEPTFLAEKIIKGDTRQFVWMPLGSEARFACLCVQRDRLRAQRYAQSRS
jgi:hypothetical protein